MIGKANFTEDLKRDPVFQINERGYPVAEVAARLGISKYSLYEWRKRYAKPAAARDDGQAAEIRPLKRDLQPNHEVRTERDAVARRVRTAAQSASQGRLENLGRFSALFEGAVEMLKKDRRYEEETRTAERLFQALTFQEKNFQRMPDPHENE